MCQKQEGCKDPEGCRGKRPGFALSNAQAVEEYGQNEYEKLREEFAAEGFSCIKLSSHAQERMYEKAFSKFDLRIVILEGDPIEYYQNSFGTQKIALWGNVQVGRKSYRPLHIILKKGRGQGKWSVVTVYDPRNKAWRWNNSFTERICFCPENNIM